MQSLTEARMRIAESYVKSVLDVGSWGCTKAELYTVCSLRKESIKGVYGYGVYGCSVYGRDYGCRCRTLGDSVLSGGRMWWCRTFHSLDSVGVPWHPPSCIYRAFGSTSYLPTNTSQSENTFLGPFLYGGLCPPTLSLLLYYYY
jgi:hypothetical protein